MRFILTLLFVLTFQLLHSQKENQEQYSILFYNVENLFDCLNDSTKQDDEFLPDGEKSWSKSRMYNKIAGLSKTILSCNAWQAPELIGLCEVENRWVIQQLIYNTGLSGLNYQLVHFESDDKRGIDVALLYRKNSFTPLHSGPIKLSKAAEDFFTRDALYVKGIIHSDTVHLFVNHWPSKRGGSLESESKRARVAQQIIAFTDSIHTVNPNAKLILVGDFNTEYDNSVLQNLCVSAAISSKLNINEIRNNRIGGTYKYQGQWSIIDHILVSNTWLQDNRYVFDHKIVELPFLLEADPTYSGVKPKRTYAGPRYIGGISDHLPVLLSVKRKDIISELTLP